MNSIIAFIIGLMLGGMIGAGAMCIFQINHQKNSDCDNK